MEGCLVKSLSLREPLYRLARGGFCLGCMGGGQGKGAGGGGKRGSSRGGGGSGAGGGGRGGSGGGGGASGSSSETSSSPCCSTTCSGGDGSGSNGSPIRLMAAVEFPGKHHSSNTAWLEMMNCLSTGSQKCQAFTPSGYPMKTHFLE